MQDFKASKAVNTMGTHGILTSDQSPIKRQDEEKEGDFLFNEDVDKYESFLRKSTYLDSPR